MSWSWGYVLASGWHGRHLSRVEATGVSCFLIAPPCPPTLPPGPLMSLTSVLSGECWPIMGSHWVNLSYAWNRVNLSTCSQSNSKANIVRVFNVSKVHKCLPWTRLRKDTKNIHHQVSSLWCIHCNLITQPEWGVSWAWDQDILYSKTLSQVKISSRQSEGLSATPETAMTIWNLRLWGRPACFTWIVSRGPDRGASVDLTSEVDPVEPWGSSLRAWSGESPSLLLSSSKAKASAALEKLTSEPEWEKTKMELVTWNIRELFRNATKYRPYASAHILLSLPV